MEKSGNPLCHAGLRGVKVQAGKDFLRGIGGYTVSFQLYTPHDSCCCTLPIRDENSVVSAIIVMMMRPTEQINVVPYL